MKKNSGVGGGNTGPNRLLCHSSKRGNYLTFPHSLRPFKKRQKDESNEQNFTFFLKKMTFLV